jgi:hypothetical protein
VNVQIRVGLNSGEVVVRAIGSDLHMDYTAVGQTTHLAARMEQTANPGTVLLTADTLRLAEGRVEVASLGLVQVKGLSVPVDVYELLGAGAARTRFEAAASGRRLSEFVGRDAELGALDRALVSASRGRGQVVAVVGEAGVGKSRLFYELIHSPAARGWRVRETRAVSHGAATTFLPLVALLKTYFEINDADSGATIAARVDRALGVLDPELSSCRAPVLSLLEVPIGDAQAGFLPRSQRGFLSTLRSCSCGWLRAFAKESQ